MSNHSPFLSKKQPQGLTLIELMIGIAVIGIFVAVAIPAYTDFMKMSTVTEGQKLLIGLKIPTEEYLSSKGEFPTSMTPLTIQTGGKDAVNLKRAGYTSISRTILDSIGFKDDADLSSLRWVSVRDTDVHWWCGHDCPCPAGALPLPQNDLPNSCSKEHRVR